MPVRRKLVREIREALRRLSDPQRAAGQQAYMKSEMPYRGVRTPDVRRIVKALLPAQPCRSCEELEETVLKLWRDAEYREERHAAIEICEAPEHDQFQSMELLPMYEEMITSGAWWDLVDPIAGHRLRRLLEKQPKQMRRRMLTWSRTRDIWKRRSAMLCQLRRRGETDLDLLYRAIEPSLESDEFFLRKAIGWALRDYGWHDPDEVERYVEEQGERMSRLSRREALKSLDKARARRS